MNGSMYRGATTSGIMMCWRPSLFDSSSSLPPVEMETTVAPLLAAVFIMAIVSGVWPEALQAIASVFFMS
jgi:hypothetical protein